MSTTISIIYGSVRDDRQGIKAAKYLENKLKERDVNVRFIDPLEYQLPFLNKMYKEFTGGSAPQHMETIANHFRESDAFLVVTGEYNHSIPPALKNLLDHFQSEYLFKPSAIASYSAGSFGGVRAAVHLRVILGELGTPAISSMQPFPAVQDLFDENFNVKNERIDKSVNRFLDELIWYAEAFANKRKSDGTPF
ncbi:NADPH-dependent FMN reductase [Marinilabilia salmonicolor]|uniref:NAD(P)H-dependent FMN reductase n=1 Tax=Marinilabilia salmonicolor TaxID=989 RepID=A0A368VDF8_9BACT|nr:NADPH-dependent FMN reductase [Marinilabilia salmonicolor]RCW38330.1 NAD(P)H-dependent FMN reductase [Marinilabilia salmonicolor]